ncbi:hypothetical protein LIMNO130_30130 [Limnobacter sp. 130]|nr:hypothetical protein LIMNO130_30130 [Limnobacter sp. 130]
MCLSPCPRPGQRGLYYRFLRSSIRAGDVIEFVQFVNCLGFESFRLLVFLTYQAYFPGLHSRTGRMRLGLIPSAEFRYEHHVDAVNRTGRNAQLTARAEFSQDRMSAFAAANDGINWARLDAQGAANAMLGVDARNVSLNG